MGIETFGKLTDGREVRRIEIEDGPLKVAVLDYGATLQKVEHSALPCSATLGAVRATAYEGVMGLFGPVVGPVANRIGGAEMTLDGRTLHLPANQDGRHTLHSGDAGCQYRIWQIAENGPAHVVLALDLPDGEGGFPGNRQLRATYRAEDGALHVDFEATTDATSPVNLALHAFWTAQVPQSWAGQVLTIHADDYLPVDDDTLPTGEIRPVEGTPFDFRGGRTLGPDTPSIDHNFCLAHAPREAPEPAVRLEAPDGAWLEILTDAPGLQVFDMSKFGSGDAETIHGAPYPKKGALAFEPQHWPDAPGRPDWPDIILKAGETYRQRSIYRFGRS